MSKISVGDYVVDEYGNTGHVVFCRGGYVGRWRVKFDSGSIGYKSSRDLTVLATADCKPMTNYNERLDEIFKQVQMAGGGLTSVDRRKLIAEAKQAHASLTKELVAESKPKEYVHYYATDPLEGGRKIGYDEAVREFEQNLLKALEVDNER